MNVHYQIVKVDLSSAHTLYDAEIHPYQVEYYNELKVLYAPSAFWMVLNTKQNDAIPVQADQVLTLRWFKITNLYITNEAGAGTAYIWLASRLRRREHNE